MSMQLRKIETSIRETARLLEEAILAEDTERVSWLRKHLNDLNNLKLSLLS